jgi:ATP-binding cassette subfamily B protein
VSDHDKPTTVPKTRARSEREMLAMVLPYLKPHALQVTAAVVFLLLAKLATVAVPLVLKEVVDHLDPTKNLVVTLPVVLLLAYGALRFASAGFRELQSMVFNVVQNSVVRDMSVRVLRHLHGLSLRFHLNRRTGAISRDVSRGTQSVGNLLNFLLFNIVPTLLEVAMVAGILVYSYGTAFAVTAVITFVAYVVLTFGITQWRLKYRVAMNSAESKASGEAIDSLMNFETVKYFANEQWEIDRYHRSLRNWEAIATKSQNSLSLLNGGQQLIIALGVTAMMWLASQGVVAGTMTLGDLFAVNAFLLQLFMPLGFLGTVYSIIKHAFSDMERMFELLEEKPEVEDRPESRPLAVRGGAIRLEHVSFAYDADRPILHDVSLEIPAGSKVAIVGPSGSGKSTLARLLFRFYDVGEGRITIDDQDVRDVAIESLHRAIGVVPQDTVLFNDTIASNLRYARLDATQADLDAACKTADIGRFIDSLPEGFETTVGERGLKLSGGEKQRMAIARVVLKNPPILIFDEATSSLDSASERAILDAMREAAARRTSVVIAHRLSTIIDADNIVVLEHGHVVEQGRHAELLERNGLYARLWSLQQQESGEAGAH